jgi:glycosyltransferase involved in cell wall biosynthesis
MLNVFILSPMALENGRGGEISSMELASGLSKFYDVTFMDTNIFLGDSLLSKEVINQKLHGLKKSGRINFATLNIYNKCFNFPYPWEIIKLFRKIRNNDIIYTSISNFKINLLFMFFSLIHRNARYIVGYRKPLHSEKFFSLYNLKYRLSILFLSLFKKRFYHHALSGNAKKFLNQFYNSKHVIHIIHGIDLNKFSDDSFDIKSKNMLKFIYIGYLDDIHKGVNVLIESIKRFLNDNKNLKVFFEFCGMGPLDSKIRLLEKNYPKFIKFHGYVSNDLIPDYYRKGDVYLFTSRSEPFPRTIMEALASNLVILCSKTIGSVELLQGKEFAFFIEDIEPNLIADKLLQIYNLWESNPLKFRNLQKQSKKYIFENYSFSKELKIFRNLIDNLTKNIKNEIP